VYTEKEILHSFVDYRDSMELALENLEGVLLGHGYIIVCDGLALLFDDSPNPSPTTPDKASRFEKEQAEELAPKVKNGLGIKGEVVHVKDAIRSAIDRCSKSINLLETEMFNRGLR